MESVSPLRGTVDARAPLHSAQQLRHTLRRGVYFLRRMDHSGKLTSQQISLMSMLMDGGVRMTTIAASLGVRTPTATQSVDRLHKMGLVQRHTDPADARAVLVSLTEHGMNVIDDEDRYRNEVVADALGLLEDHERAALDAALPVIAKLAATQDNASTESLDRPVRLSN